MPRSLNPNIGALIVRMGLSGHINIQLAEKLRLLRVDRNRILGTRGGNFRPLDLIGSVFFYRGRRRKPVGSESESFGTPKST